MLPQFFYLAVQERKSFSRSGDDNACNRVHMSVSFVKLETLHLFCFEIKKVSVLIECLLIAFTGGETVETNVSVYSEATQYVRL